MRRFPLSTFTAVGLVVFASGALAACTGDDIGSDEGNQTASKPVEVRFDVTSEVRGEQTSPSGAEESWRAACSRFEATLREISAPAVVEEVDCGEKSQLIGGSVVQFASTARATIVTKLPKELPPASFEPGDVMAPALSSENDAVRSWVETCEASLRQAKALYGDRLLAGSCGAPKSFIGGSIIGYRSTPTLWVAPAPGGATEVAGFAQGTGNSEQAAHSAWRASCDAWLLRTAQLSGAENLTAYSCGTRKNVLGGSTWIVESEPTVELMARLVDDAAPDSETFTVKGQQLASPTAAKSSAIDACELEVAKRKEALGERFLSGSCAGMRTLLGGSVSEFEVTGTVLSGDLAPMEEPAPDAEEPIEPSPIGPDPEQSQPAENCQSRCTVMFDACNAGPAEAACQTICDEIPPTEGELACAEKVACENFDDWFNVCSLGV
jgi:hypothetical protein